MLHNIKRDHFSNNSFGIIHLGASSGQERFLYNELDLDVIWVEAIPEVASTMLDNIKDYPKQIGYQALLTDKVGEQYDFKITNNSCSSSIFDLALHLEAHPHVYQSDTINLTSTTLPQLINEQHIDISKYKVLLLDTQGSELLILQGAESILSNFDIIITEVSDFESYRGCPNVKEMSFYLHKMGFLEEKRELLVGTPVGDCYDILYKNFRFF